MENRSNARLCDKEFHVEIEFHHHMITHRETWKLLLGDGHDPEESTINVPVQFAPSQCIRQFNQDNSKTQEKTIVFSSHNSTALTDQLPDNTGLVESNSHPFQMEDRQVQVEPNLTKASSRLATANPYSPPRSANGGLMDALIKFDNSYDKVVSESAEEVDESQSSNDTTTKFNQSQGEGYSSKSVNGKRISVADGIVYEVSSSESSQCSAITQTLLVSDQVEVVTEHPSSSSRHSVNDPGTSSSFFSHVESMVSSKLPPGSTLVSDRGVFRIEDKEKPFTCSYCGKNYITKKAVYAHITQHHDEKSVILVIIVVNALGTNIICHGTSRFIRRKSHSPAISVACAFDLRVIFAVINLRIQRRSFFLARFATSRTRPSAIYLATVKFTRKRSAEKVSFATSAKRSLVISTS